MNIATIKAHGRGCWAVVRLAWITLWAYLALHFDRTARVVHAVKVAVADAYVCGRDNVPQTQISYEEGDAPNQKLIIFPYDRTGEQ